MALPKLQVIHCNVDQLQAQLEPLISDYAVMQTYYYQRGDALWCVYALAKIEPQKIAIDPRLNNFRPR